VLLCFDAAGCAFRWRSAPRGHVALEFASGLGAETAAEHALRLGAHKLGPAGADPPRRRPEARGAQHVRDCGRRDADSELQQLALDAHIAPARVFPRHPQDQAASLGRKRRTARRAAAPSAIALQQRPVPAAERLWPDRKARPPLGHKQPARRGKQGTVGGRVLRPPPSAPQDRHLMAENHDLELALTAAPGEQPNETTEEPIQQTGQQDAQSEPLRPSSPAPPSTAESSFFTPQATVSLLCMEIEQALSVLHERERQVIELRFGLHGGQPRTLEEVGRAFGVTGERIRQIENNTLKTLASLPEAQGLKGRSLTRTGGDRAGLISYLNRRATSPASTPSLRLPDQRSEEFTILATSPRDAGDPCSIASARLSPTLVAAVRRERASTAETGPRPCEKTRPAFERPF